MLFGTCRICSKDTVIFSEVIVMQNEVSTRLAVPRFGWLIYKQQRQTEERTGMFMLVHVQREQ